METWDKLMIRAHLIVITIQTMMMPQICGWIPLSLFRLEQLPPQTARHCMQYTLESFSLSFIFGIFARRSGCTSFVELFHPEWHN